MFTIGYATKPVDVYVAQLLERGVTVVADVRSVPYSKRFYEYHRESLMQHLQQAGIRYVYLGEELGPRSKDPQHYDETGQVQFDRLVDAPLYRAGEQRLLRETGTTIDMLAGEVEALQMAWKKQCLARAYRKSE